MAAPANDAPFAPGFGTGLRDPDLLHLVVRDQAAHLRALLDARPHMDGRSARALLVAQVAAFVVLAEELEERHRRSRPETAREREARSPLGRVRRWWRLRRVRWQAEALADARAAVAGGATRGFQPAGRLGEPPAPRGGSAIQPRRGAR